MMNQHGELVDKQTVRFVRLLPGPLDRVWQHIVDPQLRSKWLCGGETELNVGGHVDLHFHNASLSKHPDIDSPEKYKDLPDKVSFSGTVTRCDPPRLLAHTWDFEEDHSEVRYELKKQDDKVLLTLTHTRLKSRDEMISVCGGWHTHLEILDDILTGNDPRPFWKTHTGLEAQYEERL